MNIPPSPIGILGTGHALPDTVRTNDDPLFLRAPEAPESNLFYGFNTRRVLQDHERIESFGAQAARAALAEAKVDSRKIDRIYGVVSPGEHLSPSGLFSIHSELGLRSDVSVIPIHADFTNFIDALVAAWEAIASGRCTYALVVVAGAWSRLVDYADAGARGVGDGAGAAVVGRVDDTYESFGEGRRPLTFVDSLTETRSEWHKAMTVQVRRRRRESASWGADPQLRPTFVFEAEGERAFRELAVSVPAHLWNTVLGRHALQPSDVALIAHQASIGLLDAWQKVLSPGEFPSELRTLGNMTVATSAVTLDLHRGTLTSPYVFLLGLGCGQHFSALLLKSYG